MYSLDQVSPLAVGTIFTRTADPLPVVTGAWLAQELVSAAETVARDEPILAPCMKHIVLDRCSVADMVSALLADALASCGISKADLHILIRRVLEDSEYTNASLVADVGAVLSRDPACTGPLHVLMNMKGFHALEAHRVANWLWRRNRKPFAAWLAARSATVFSVDIHPAAEVGAGVFIDHASGVVIGETSIVEDDVSILQGVTLGGTGKETGDRHPIVRQGVLIGAGAKVLGRIEIGARSKIAAGSVVLGAVPANCTVAGVPARIVRFNGSKLPPAHSMDQSI